MSLVAKSSILHLSRWVIRLIGIGSIILPLLLVESVEAREKYREVAVSDGATIAGETIFKGPPPGPYVIWVSSEEDIFGEKLPDEKLIVSRAGKIKNVLVTIEGIMEGKPWPNLNPRIVNEGGRFIPHFGVARVGTELEIINKDPVFHNTHAIITNRTLFNLAQPLQDHVIRKTLRRQGLVEIMCDAHDWMNGWLAILNHPYYALTGEDGAYKITDIPAGTYKLTAWHEKLGQHQVQVKVKAGEQIKINFEYPVK